MRPTRLYLLLIASLLLISNPALAVEKELRIDSFSGNGQVAVQAGAVNGDRFGVLLDTDAADYPLTVKSVSVLYADQLMLGSATNDTGVTFYQNDGANGVPSTQIAAASGTYTLNASESMINQIDLVSENIMIPSGPFYVVLDVNRPMMCQLFCTDSYATDTDGLQMGKNIVWDSNSNSWAFLESFGAASGDWIIRVTVETSNGQMMDMTMDMGMDMGVDMGADMGVDMGADMGADTGVDMEGDTMMPASLTITEVNPNMAQMGESPLVQVRGTGFVDGTTIRVGAEALENLEVVSDTIINGNVPSTLDVGTYALNAQNPDGAQFTFPDAFTVTEDEVVMPDPPPAIASVMPSEAVAGDTVTISGSNFVDPVSVEIGSTELPAVQYVDDTEIRVVVPNSLADGTYSVTVINPDDQSDTLANALTIGGGAGGDDGCGCSTVRKTDESSPLTLLGVLLFVGFVLFRRRHSTSLESNTTR